MSTMGKGRSALGRSASGVMTLVLLTLVMRSGSACGEEPTGILEGYPLEILAKLERRDGRLNQLVPRNTARSVIDNLRIWPAGRQISVAFRGGNTLARTKIEELANTWAQHANFTFQFKDNSGQWLEWSPADSTYQADIRIGFDLSGYWSLVGTDSLQPSIVSPGRRSMNLSGMADGLLSNDEQGTVLHEFGHALGVHHEHQSPVGGCDAEFRWDNDPGYVETTDHLGRFIADHLGRRPGIYTQLGGPPNKWSPARIDFNLRQLPNSSAFNASAHDPNSIMHYSFQDWMFVNGTSSPCFTARNNQLSAQDIAGIQAAYPATPSNDPFAGLGSMPQMSQLIWMPPSASKSSQSAAGNSCCGSAHPTTVPQTSSVNSVEALEAAAAKRATPGSPSMSDDDYSKNIQALTAYANTMAGNDDQMFTQMVVGARGQARMMREGGGTRTSANALSAMMFESTSQSGLIWNSPQLTKNFRTMMNLAAKDQSGLVPITGPPIMGRVVGPGSQLVGNARFRDCVAVGQRIAGQNRYCCTGTLVTPKVVVTAGHCFFCNGGGANNAVVYVGGNINTPGQEVRGKAFRHPRYNVGQRNDLAIIVLDTPVTGVAPRKIATSAQIAKMTFGRVVGFGNSDFNGSMGFGIKRMVDVPVASLSCEGPGESGTLGCDPTLELVAGFVGLGADSCKGDSGGPIYALVGADARDDDAWVVVGATSRATSLATRICGDGGIYERLDQFKSFIDNADGTE